MPEARHVHGEDGLAGLSRHYPPDRKPAKFKNGIDLIIDLALSKKIDTIIATGPLTDLARAINKNPAFLKNLDEIIIMGGAAFTKGNINPHAEFNFHCDPKAAGIVLNANVKKRLVSLDVTHKTLLTADMIGPLEASATRAGHFIASICEYAICVNRQRGFDGAPMHDPLAVALAIDEGIGEYQDLRLDVVAGGRQKGKVIVRKGKPNVRFCKKVNADRFFKLFIKTLSGLSQREERA